MSIPSGGLPLGIVGFGHFGRALASLADAASLPYLAYDARPGSQIPVHRAAPTLADISRGVRTLVLCVPIGALERCLADLRPSLTPDHFVMDVGSVKVQPAATLARMLGRDVPWCATHPLFGPAALARAECPLRAVICPNDLHPDVHRRAACFFQSLGCQTIEQSPEDHDRLMADTHALAFFVAKAMLDLGAGQSTEFVPPSFRAMAQTIDTVRVDAGHLFSVIQLANPFAAAARRRLIDALEHIDADLRSAPSGAAKSGLEISPADPTGNR